MFLVGVFQTLIFASVLCVMLCVVLILVTGCWWVWVLLSLWNLLVCWCYLICCLLGDFDFVFG